MKHLWQANPAQVLAPFLAQKTLFAFDYDGTLAPIVDDPLAAVLAPTTRALLNELASRSPVAIITGRARADVSRFLDPGFAYIIGNHGIEGLASEERFAQHAKAASNQWRTHLEDQLAALPGVGIEAKLYSLSVHFRGVPSAERDTIADRLYAICAGMQPPPRLVRGKDVLNVVLPGAPDKGTALLEIMAAGGFTAAIFVGDDVTDEDVFRLRRPDILTIGVGRGPDSAASYGIRGQDEIDSLLRLCLGQAAP